MTNEQLGQFVKHNENPRNKKVNDCAVRAISKATNFGWTRVFKELCDVAFDNRCMPHDKVAGDKYLESLGFTRVSCQPKKGEKRVNVKTLAGSSKGVVMVASVAGHLTCIIDGKYYDTWDCGDKCVYYYYMRKI